MADRYQDRPLSADGFGRGGDQQQRADSDPLAELARLIGQNNESTGRGNTPPPSHAAIPQNQFQTAAGDDKSAGGPPPWMQRANRKEVPREQQRDFQTDEPEQSHFQALSNALNRYGAQPPPVEQNFHDDEPSFERAEERPDPSRYDDALFGQLNTGAQEDFHHDNAFPDDPYAFQEEGYEDEEAEDEPEPKRRGGLMKVAAVLALAVIGTGAAFAYRTYVGSSRTGEPPIIKADNSPTKIVPSPQDGGSPKVPDRLAMGDGTEKLISREETPVDVNSRSIGGGGGGPRVVFPQLNPNSNPPSPSSVAPNGLPPAGASNGTMPNNEPRKIRTLSVRGDQPDTTAATQAPASPPPAAGAKPAAAAKTARNAPSPANANASANAPMSISPQSAQDSVAPPAAEPRARVAATNPAQTEPAASPAASGGGGYLVQISSQRNEADAQSSFKALQGKFPSVLGSQTPVIKRADLGEKGVYYRAMVGPFGTSDEAAQFCNSLRSAGGQCFVPRNQ
jgi:SPOR domain